jgi:hypothetical protein
MSRQSEADCYQRGRFYQRSIAGDGGRNDPEIFLNERLTIANAVSLGEEPCSVSYPGRPRIALCHQHVRSMRSVYALNGMWLSSGPAEPRLVHFSIMR